MQPDICKNSLASESFIVGNQKLSVISEPVDRKIKKRLRKIGLLKLIGIKDILLGVPEREAEDVLDLGCGDGGLLSWINDRRRFRLRVGCDITLDLLKMAKRRGAYDCYVLADVRCLPFRGKSFDVCFMMSVLTYLEKKDGLAALKAVEYIARRQIIVFTPVGILPPPSGERFEKYEHWNENAHISSWTKRDFHGYRIIGINGLRRLRNRRGKIRYSGFLKIVATIVSYLSQIIIYFHPRFAFEMVCIKSPKKATTTIKSAIESQIAYREQDRPELCKRGVN